MTKYYMPTKIIFGEKTFGELFSELREAKVKKPLIICGKHFISSLRYRVIQDTLPFFKLFTEVQPNPSTASVDAAAKMLNEENCDAVIGIGGGSILDVAKVVACMKNYGKSCESFYKRVSPKTTVPFFALPTTSGSGSEITKYSVLTTNEGMKKTLKSDKFYAKIAIVDPQLTYSMPPELTAATGIDAFSQAMESYWSKGAMPETDKWAEESIKLSYFNLVKAVKDPDKYVRINMSLASLNAARAFSNTGTTACHTLSYAFTKHYGLVHGFAVAITLPWFLGFYAEKNEKKCLDICSFIGADGIEDGKAKITQLLQQIGAPARLGEIGFVPPDAEKIIEMSMRHKPNNPRRHTHKDLEQLLVDLY